MIAAMLTTVRWILSLGAKFGREVPFYTLAIVLLTLVSQVATLLASFLPLKVVILLGSERIPRYFPPYFAELDRDVVIAALSIATVGFFLAHLLSERLIAWVTARATRQLMGKSHKMVLFENQDDVAANAYQRYSRALAGGVFVLLAVLGLAIFYPGMSWVVVGYAALVLLALALLYATSAMLRERLESKLTATLGLIGGIGFFVAFGYLVADFIFWSPPGVIVAIVSLLLSRQLMIRATGMVGDLAILQQQRVKLDALFFHGKVLLPQQLRADKTLWPLLEPERREQWVRLVLVELLGNSPDALKIEWHQLGMPNVAGLRVWADGDGFLIKLFETYRSSLALHEATLMGEALKALPGLPWVGITQVQRYHCLVHALPNGKAPALRQAKKLVIPLKTRLLAVEPSSPLIERYQRSKPMLWQRLDGSTWERLKVAANTPEQRDQVEAFLTKLPALLQQLKALPLAVVNPDAHQDAVWIPKNSPPLLTNWGAWSLEPVGAGWADKPQMLPLLTPALKEAEQTRPSLANVSPEQAELAALAFALEREYNRQRFVQALDLLPELLERLHRCEARRSEPSLAQ